MAGGEGAEVFKVEVFGRGLGGGYDNFHRRHPRFGHHLHFQMLKIAHKSGGYAAVGTKNYGHALVAKCFEVGASDRKLLFVGLGTAALPDLLLARWIQQGGEDVYIVLLEEEGIGKKG